MNEIKDLAKLEELTSQGVTLILFGGENCGVCTSIKPQVEKVFSGKFPEVKQLYIDCEQSTDICAQFGVFTLPVVQVYFDGQKFLEEVRVFGVQNVAKQLERPYEIWKGE